MIKNLTPESVLRMVQARGAKNAIIHHESAHAPIDVVDGILIPIEELYHLLTDSNGGPE